MKHYTTKMVSSKTVKELDKTTCDSCKKIINEDETTVERKWSKWWWPDTNYPITAKYDLCCECFDKEIMSVLADKGIYPQIIES